MHAGSAAGVLFVLAGIAYAEPRLVLEPTSWNFSEVWHGEHPELTLLIKNEGDSDLVLNDVRTTCGCTVAQPDMRTVPPGQAARVKVKYDTTGKQGDVESKVIIATNDARTGPDLGNREPSAKRGEAHMPIKGHVKRAIVRTPLGGLVIRTLEGKRGQAGTVRLENKMPQPMKLELVRNSLHEIDVDIREITPGLVYEIVGTLNRDVPAGTIVRGEMEFKTGLEREPSFVVHGRVQVFKSVEASPPCYLLRPDDAAVDRVVSLQYYGAAGTKFEVTGYECADKNVQVTLQPTRAPEPWMKTMKPPMTAVADVKMKIPPGSAIPKGGILVTFKTNDPECPKVDVLLTTEKPLFEARMHGEISKQ